MFGRAARKSDFDITTNGNPHNVCFQKSGMGYSLYIDGNYSRDFKTRSFLSGVMGDIDDYEFELDGASVIVAARFGKYRVAVDGIYIDNGDEFKAVLPVPPWAAIFVVLAIFPPIVFRSTFFDYIIAVSCSYLCTHYIIRNPDMKASMTRKIIYASVVVAASWAFFAFFFIAEGGRGAF